MNHLQQHPFLIIGIISILGVTIYQMTFLKTLYLIARVSPFEQTIENAPTLLVLGDSTGYGTGATNSTYTVPGRIGNDFRVSIQNESVNGRTIGELLEDTKDFNGQYEIILLMIGANDIIQKRNPETVETELRSLVERLSSHTEHLLMISSGNVGGAVRYNETESEEYTELTRKFRSAYIAVGKSTPLSYIDLFNEPENDPFVLEPESYTAIDGLHPSNLGYELWYNKLKPNLNSLLTN